MYYLLYLHKVYLNLYFLKFKDILFLNLVFNQRSDVCTVNFEFYIKQIIIKSYHANKRVMSCNKKRNKSHIMTTQTQHDLFNQLILWIVFYKLCTFSKNYDLDIILSTQGHIILLILQHKNLLDVWALLETASIINKKINTIFKNCNSTQI